MSTQFRHPSCEHMAFGFGSLIYINLSLDLLVLSGLGVSTRINALEIYLLSGSPDSSCTQLRSTFNSSFSVDFLFLWLIMVCPFAPVHCITHHAAEEIFLRLLRKARTLLFVCICYLGPYVNLG